MGNSVDPACASCWNDSKTPAIQTLVMRATAEEAVLQELPSASPWDELDGSGTCAPCWNDAKGPIVKLVDHSTLDDGTSRVVPGAAEWEQILVPGMLKNFHDGTKEEPLSPSVASTSGAGGSTDKLNAPPSIISFESTAPSTSSGADQSREAQLLVQEFTRSIVTGCRLSVLTTAGGDVQCLVSLNIDLSTLFVQRPSHQGGKRTCIPLAQIDRICAGEAAGDVGLELDENCCTVMCDSLEAMAFRFNDLEERDTFVLCINLFADRAKEGIERVGAQLRTQPVSLKVEGFKASG